MSPEASDWSAAGCYPVAPGIHRIPLPMPNDGLRAVSVYAVESADGLALVDGGWHVPEAWDRLAAGLRAVGGDVTDVADVYVTHVHRDHYTLALELRRRVGARVHLGRGEATGLQAVRALGSNVPISSLRELARAGAAHLGDPVVEATRRESFDLSDWQDPDTWLDPGIVDLGTRRWEVVPTPGHTKGHVVLHDLDAGLMFTGDHVLPTITPSIGFELGEWALPLGQYLGSLSRLLDRPDAEMLPAHGHHGGSVHERVVALLAHHDRRLGEIVAVAGSNPDPVTGLQVAERLSWTKHGRAFYDLDAFNRMIAVCETLAHLDVLVDRGTLVAEPGASDEVATHFRG
ncbi:MBL fold metallo-hydrolase [Nocardioides plantarum]|uniref:MBL fold metallo-hydrolase n=1 Tax=Nocardioides plantarum TaxID=29299 RepID=A0ABV5KHB8_9ACTN|nr:MBL fold metallo-hydrolase [Nocardioides plantarum]